MPLAVWLVLAAAVLASLLALGLTIRTLVQRLGQLGNDLDRLQRDLTPALHQLELDGQVTATEVRAIGDRIEERARSRAARRPRRWRPGPS